MKRTISFIMAFILAAVIPAFAQAEAWVGTDFTFTAPEDMYQLGLNTDPGDPSWALAGIGDPEEKLKEYQDMSVLVNFISKDGGNNIALMRKEVDQSKQIFDIRLLDEDEKADFLEGLATAQDDSVTISKDWYENSAGLLFFKLKIDLDGEQEMHELIYGTIMNGYTLNVDIHTVGADITEEQNAAVMGIVDSMEFTSILEKPPEDTRAAFNALLLLILLVIAVVGPLVYVPIKSRVDKKKKAKLAEQLSQFHKTNGRDIAHGDASFINKTDCTREAIHRFSIYQAYVKNIGELIFGALLCVVTVSASFLIDAAWWMKLAAVAVTVYYVYKLIAMPGAVEKIQTKVHDQGMSRTASYTFYPDVFRVSGIQSSNVVPYFQIVDIRKCGQYLYLYYGPDNAYLVDNYGFELGEPQDFEKFIREKTGK